MSLESGIEPCGNQRHRKRGHANKHRSSQQDSKRALSSYNTERQKPLCASYKAGATGASVFDTCTPQSCGNEARNPTRKAKQRSTQAYRVHEARHEFVFELGFAEVATPCPCKKRALQQHTIIKKKDEGERETKEA